jgi:hypothetical protein
LTRVTPRAVSAGRISAGSRSESRSRRHSPSPSPPACPETATQAWQGKREDEEARVGPWGRPAAAPPRLDPRADGKWEGGDGVEEGGGCPDQGRVLVADTGPACPAVASP